MTSSRQLERATAETRAPGPDQGGVVSTPDPERYGRWRARTLLLVYVLMAAHVIHWKVAGRTLAPLELNEVMYTFELGIVTAGFLFMLVAMLATAIFGRFFCSWGCHILALQDLCSWLLAKLRIQPKGIRSRMLLWVPLLAMLYMFVWPQAVRLWEGRTIPVMHLTADEDGWASFMTEDFARNLPGVGITVATFLICGFVIVYVLGSRGFCTYGCPYGAVFALMDRFAPGRIRVGADCTQCGECTAVCSSHIRVHEELERYGTVVNPACMKDLDCVAVCSQQSLHYGFGKPSLVQGVVGVKDVRKRYDFTLGEEALMAVLFTAMLVIFRGLYDVLPFLLSIALAAIGAYVITVGLRLFRMPLVKFNRWPLKIDGRLRPVGWLFTGLAIFGLGLTMHSGVVRYHYLQGRRHYRAVNASGAGEAEAIARATLHLRAVDRLGIFTTRTAVGMLADLFVRAREWPQAGYHLKRLVGWSPDDAALRARLAHNFSDAHDLDSARSHYLASIDLDPTRPETHFALAGVYFGSQDPDAAVAALREAIRLRPTFTKAHVELGSILIQTRDFPGGIAHLREAIKLERDHADAHYNLAVALAMTGHVEEALKEIAVARELQPADEKTAAFERFLMGGLESQ